MADTVALDQGSTLTQPSTLQLLMNAIGGVTNQTVNKSDNTTGTTGTTGTNTTQGNSSTQSTANVDDLQKVFQQQQAGITPAVLAAIFQEGSKAAPGLIAANANAVGARSVNNDPLATSLTNLQAQLTNQAATLDLQQKNASADTAAKIAQLTAGSTTTNTNNQNSNQNTTSAGTDTSTTGNQTDTQPNYANLTKILGTLLGGQALNSGLSNIGGIAGGLTAGTNAVGNLLKTIIPGLGAPTNPATNAPTIAGTDTSYATPQIGDGSGQGILTGGNYGDAVNGLPGTGIQGAQTVGGGLSFNAGQNPQIDNFLQSIGLGVQQPAGDNTGGSGDGGNEATSQTGAATTQPVNPGGPVDTSSLPTTVPEPDWWSAEGWDNFIQ